MIMGDFNIHMKSKSLGYNKLGESTQENKLQKSFRYYNI